MPSTYRRALVASPCLARGSGLRLTRRLGSHLSRQRLRLHARRDNRRILPCLVPDEIRLALVFHTIRVMRRRISVWTPWLRAHDATETDMAGRGIHHLRRTRGGTVAQAVVRRAEV